MRKSMLAVIGLMSILVIGALATTPASASALAPAGAIFDGPVYTEQASQEVQNGQVQVQVSYLGGIASQWDEAERTYFGTLPVGIGATMKVYPNVLSGQPVIAMVAVQSELERKLEYRYDKKSKTWSFTTPGVIALRRDEGGRWYLELPLSAAVGTDIHCLRFYALVQDARRNDHSINLILFKIKWVGKGNVSAMTDTLRFKTECWPANVPAPSFQYLTDLLRRAGNGGNGLVLETLLASDGGAGDSDNGSGSSGGGASYDDSSLLVQIANLEARVASLEAYDLKIWEAVQALGRNSGKTEVEIQRLRQLVANHELTLVEVINYLKTPASSSTISTPSQTVPSQREIVYGSYSFRTSQRVWIKLYDRSNPQGRTFGPYGAGSIAINNAALGQRVDGQYTPYEFNVRFSCNGQVWSEIIIYRPTDGGVIVLPLGGGR